MPSNVFYPKLNQLISIENLPEPISKIDGLVDALIDDLYYNNLQFSLSPLGDAGFFKLELLILKRLGFEIPGTGGMELLLNPNLVEGGGNTTILPITAQYRWEVVKFFNELRASGYSGDPIAIFNIVREILDIQPQEMLQGIIAVFIDDSNPNQKFVDDYNSTRNPNTPLILNGGFGSNIISDLAIQIRNNNDTVFATALEEYILSGSSTDVLDRLKLFFNYWLDQVDFDEILKKLLVPRARVSLEDINIALQFPRTIFQPLDVNDEVIPDENVKSALTFDIGRLEFNTESGFHFEGEGNFSFQKSMILNSGFSLELFDMRLDLSSESNIPEATADGRPVDFIGAYITEGIIGFPQFWNHDDSNSTGQIVARNLLVGTGGISGTLGLEAKTAGNPSPLISANFGGGFQISLNAFNITFQQNSIIESNIHGSMQIPGFKDSQGNVAEINIDVWIGTDGEFSVTASEDQGITALNIPGVLDVRIDSLTVGRKEDRFFVAVSGGIEFEDQGGTIGQFLPDEIDIQKLIIWQDGEVELEGGTLVLPTALTLKIGPVELSITAIGFGSHTQVHNGIERKYKFFEFSGGVSINPGGVDARGDGIKFYFTVDDDEVGQSKHVFVRIQGIGIDIIIPGNAKPKDAALLLSGYLAMKDPAPGNEAAGTEYAGGIEFVLPKLKMGGSAAMRLNPKVPAFIVDIGLEISTPIPLGPTGLGIYGFRALVGQRYVATRSAAGVADDGKWWEYYKAKIAQDYKEGIQVSKFDQTNGFSLGAGVSLATASDTGKAFSSKIFFLLSLPEVFLLQGQAQMLKERIGLDTTQDPPFFAMLSISSQSVEAAFGVKYNLPDDKATIGSIAKVDALIEMGFFFNDSSAWYINIGRDLPESSRVNVRLLELFDAYFYLMLSASGIKAGAGAKFEFDEKFGPLRAELRAYIDVAGRIAFKPKQYGASIQMGGKVGLYIFKFGFSISADAGLAAEAPKPYIITGSVKVCVEVLKKERCAKFEFSWVKDEDLDKSENEIMDRPFAGKAVNMLTRETFDLFTSSSALSNINKSSMDNYVIPMDSFLDFEFLKGVKPSANVKSEFGGNTQTTKFVDYVSPQKAKSSRVRHEYHLHDIKIHAWDDNAGWVPYDIYEAATQLFLAPFITADPATLKKGFWQYQTPGLHNKLRVMAQSPLSFLSQGSGQPGDIVVEDLGITTETIYCPPDPVEKTCIDFTDLGKGAQPGDIVLNIPADQIIFYQQFLFKINGNDANIVFYPHDDFINALALRDNDELEMVFNEPMTCITFKIKTIAPNVKIHFYERVTLPDLAPTNMPQFAYELVETKTVASLDLSNPVIYDDINKPIDKVIVEACECETPEDDTPFVCNADITKQAKDLENFLDQLAINKHHTANINLYPTHNDLYDGVYQNTSLYPDVIQKRLVLQSTVDTITEDQLILSIKDNFGFQCFISLQSDNPPINWNSIIGFTNLRPYNTTLGQNFEFEIDANLSDGSTITLTGKSCYPIIECFDDCTTFIYQFCFLSLDDAVNNDNLPDTNDVQDDSDAYTEGFNKMIQPVWRPNTYYAIEIEVENILYENTPSHFLENYLSKHIFGFKTKGPIGHFHQGNSRYDDLESKDREAEFKLANLQHYIDYEKSYPNADGALIKAKPLFYINPKLSLFYIKNYVYEFYRNWDEYLNNTEVEIELESLILDPAPDTSQPPFQAISVAWLANNLPSFALDVNTLNNLAENGEACVNTTPLSPMGMNSEVAIDELKPLKLYTAIYNAKYTIDSNTDLEEVHRHVFQTSRYGTFEEQINSYILETDPDDNSIITKSAVFDIEIDNVTPSMITTASEILLGTLDENNPLVQEFADSYDRLLDGVLKTGALHPAVTTEFNVIKNDSGDVLGVLIRNPEPFNDPKIPNAEILDTIEATFGGNTLDKKIFSKDYKNVFLSNGTMNITTGIYEFVFDYKQWDGAQYTSLATVNVSIEIN